MKKYVAVLGVIFLALSCTNKIELDDDYVSVSFHVTYEGLELISETPLTKASEPNGLYGIQVMSYGDIDHPSYSDRYCYGIYDDISLLQIQFKRNHKYFVRIDYFPNGKNELPYATNGYSPLQVMPHHLAGPATLNTIVYSSSIALDYICSCSWDTTYDRYMYWNESFVPVNNDPISINLLRMNAGVTFKFEKVEGFDFSEVQVRRTEWQHNYTTAIAGDDNEIVINNLMLGCSLWGEGLPDLYEEDFEIGTPGNPSLFFKGKVELKRNTMRTYTIKMESDVTLNAMSVTCDGTPLGRENAGYLN